VEVHVAGFGALLQLRRQRDHREALARAERLHAPLEVEQV